jgi:hypothetical protein
MDKNVQKALEAFVECVDATGGVVFDGKGIVRPMGDRSWTDLGSAYIQACKALGREPKEADEEAEFEDETNSQDDDISGW